MINVIWSFIWFLVFAGFAVINRRMNEYMANKMKIQQVGGRTVFWKIKDAFKWYNLGVNAITALLAIMAFSSLIGFFIRLVVWQNLYIPLSLKTAVNFYRNSYIFIMLIPTAIGFWSLLQSMQNLNLVPISITNRSKRPLSIYLRNHLLGVVEPGQTVQNNKYSPIFKNYLIDAKDSQDNTVFSKEYDMTSLISIDGRVEIFA